MILKTLSIIRGSFLLYIYKYIFIIMSQYKYLNYDGLTKLSEILKNKFAEISNGINVKVNWGGGN